MTDELWDPGAQAERTALAWQRTGLSVVVVGALLIGAHPELPPWSGLLVMVAGGLVAAVLAPVRHRHVLRALCAGHTPLSPRTVVGSAAIVVMVAAGTGIALVIG